MTGQVSLDPRGLEAALALLRREQGAYLPTTRETRLYNAFNIAAVATAVLFLLLVVLSMVEDQELLADVGTAGFEAVVLTLGACAALFGLATAVLFFLNWSLMRKLYRHAQLRRRLKLAFYLAPAFSAQRKVTRLQNSITLAIIVVGVLMTLGGLAGLALAFLLWLSGASWLSLNTPQFIAVALTCLAMMAAGLGVASLHFVRRGKQRLDVVMQLQDTLLKQAADPAQAEVKVSAEEYAALANLERTQIIRDRAASIVTARKEAEAPGYLCQTSRQMSESKSRLAPEVLAQVESAIAGLLEDPRLRSAAADGVGVKRTLPVAGTALNIRFDVDPDRHVVRLHDLDTAQQAVQAQPSRS